MMNESKKNNAVKERKRQLDMLIALKLKENDQKQTYRELFRIKLLKKKECLIRRW